MDSTTYTLPATPKQIAYARSLALRNWRTAASTSVRSSCGPEGASRSPVEAASPQSTASVTT